LSDAPQPNALTEFIGQLHERAELQHHRYLVVLSGSRIWGQQQVQQFINHTSSENPLWIGTAPDPAYAHRNPGCAHTVLGQEYDSVVMDAHEGFDVDDFGALSGVLRGGGLFYLLAPDFSEWRGLIDRTTDKMLVAGYAPEQIGHRFIQHLTHLLNEEQHVVVIREGSSVPLLPLVLRDVAEPDAFVLAQGKFATSDQQRSVKAIIAMFDSEESSAVVLIADRGRGKSSALGIAAADLLQGVAEQIIVTGPRLNAVNAVFERAAAGMSECELSSASLKGAQGTLTFLAPDELLLNPVQADLLMVDEAAAIPGQMLRKLLALYPRVVFATTVHGYEGSGRGFELRFARVLGRERPHWKRIRLDQPVRWAANDPLEAFSFRALLMDAAPAVPEHLQDASPDACDYECLDRDALCEDESLLGEIFGLLVAAHYRTRPFDLRYLLDAPNVLIYVLRWQGYVVATAMLAKEGGFDAQTSRYIYAGLRRPRGHLLAQSLSAHVGVESAPQKNYLRVVRIAVHPELQGRGLGSALLDAVIEDAKNKGVDAIGTSFAADTRVLHFWRRRGFHTVHVGISQEHTSGSHPLMMLRPLNETGMAVFNEARQRYFARLQVLLKDVLAGLDQDLRVQLIDDQPSEVLMPETSHELLGFIYARRGFEISLYAIRPFVLDLSVRGLLAFLDNRQQVLLQRRIVEQEDWKNIVDELGLSGRREAIELMRQTLAELVDRTADETLLRFRNDLMQLDFGVHATSE
jgi:tRNA(Met) cytidine acetyltransferase